MRIVSWNIAHRHEPWSCLLDMDADIALLQEAGEPPPEVAGRIETDLAPWLTAGADVFRPRRWRTAVVRLSERVEGGVDRGKSHRSGGAGGVGSQPPGHPRRRDRDNAREQAFGGCLHVCALGVTARRHRQRLDYLGCIGAPGSFRPIRPHRQSA